jgi:hypothetical protein
MPVQVWLKVDDVACAIDPLTASGIFSIKQDLVGNRNARIVTLSTIDVIAGIELVYEQPASEVKSWVVTSNMRINIPCHSLAEIHEALTQTELSVTKIFDFPWGSQFAITDENGNIFSFADWLVEGNE